MCVDCRFRLKIKCCNLTSINRCQESYSNVIDNEKKAQRFDIEADYQNESKTFDLVLKNSFRKQIVSVLAEKFWDEAKQFDLVWILSFRSKILFQN